jgi:putative ABC transport system permease protein
VLSNLGRRKTRTLLTIGSVAVAFLLLGILVVVARAFTLGVDLSGADRLMTINKVSLIQPLPVAYSSRIRAVEGVAGATHATWFGGTYQDPKHFFAKFPVVPEEYFAIYSDLFELPDEAMERWLRTRDGVVVGRAIAERFDWQVGDRVPIIPDIWQKKGGGPWELEVVGIYDVKEAGADNTQLLMRYDYFDEARAFGEGLVGWYIVQIADPSRAAEVAERIDEQFANSPAETKTSTERAFVQAFANQIGDIGLISAGILIAVFFTILLVAGTTMAQSVRERVGEIGALKAIGFSDRSVLGLVLAEACVISFCGAALGLGLAMLMIPGLAKAVQDYLVLAQLPLPSLALGAGIALLLGLVAGGPPAIAAMRLRVADALRRAQA